MSSSSWINLDALWKIVVVGVLLGAGLPALFAIGLRALSPAGSGDSGGSGGSGSGGSSASGANAVGKAIAVVCFAVVLAGIAWGVYKIVHPG